MAETSKNNIFYNDNENDVADVQKDMKKMAESIDDAIEMSRKFNKEIINDILPSVKATGEEIKLSNTAEAILKKVKVSGNSKQETRDGKNKFNLDYIRQPFSNFKITDTGVNITKCWVADLYTSENVIKTFKPNTTYTMKVKAKVVSRPSTMASSQSALFALHRATSGDLPSVWRECISMPDKETIALNKEKEYITTFTTPTDMTNVRFLTYTFYGNNDGSTTGTVLGEIDVSEIMLVEGSYTSETFPEFELYGVSPTPKYPSKIKNIEGNMELKVVGNNFWNNQEFITNIPGANYELTDTGFNFTRNTLTGGKYAYISIEAKAGKTYTFSATKTYEGDSPSLYLYKDMVYGTALKSTTDNYLTYTPREDMTILFTIIIGGLVTSAQLSNIKIEEGSTVTSYKQHQAQTVIFTLNEGQRLCESSYLESDGIHHNRTRIVLNGTENWDIRSDTHEMRLNLSSYNAIYGSKILCDKLVQATSYNGTGNKIRWVLNSQIICICSEELNTANMTLAEWKQYLSENNLIIEIGITEKIEPYTSDQTQEFNEIQKLKSYSDETNIYSTDEIKPIFDVEAFKDLETYIKEVIAMEVNA